MLKEKVSFKDRVVIVTGAGGGLGRAHALEVARLGGNVIVNDLGGNVEGTGEASSAMADQVVDEIRAAGGNALANYDSVASRVGAHRIVEQAMDEFGRIDALINNAGNMRLGPFEECPEEDFNAIQNVHLRGSFLVTQAVWPHLKRASYGRIVFTSSSAGMFGKELHTAYASAKGGVAALMNALSVEGEPHGILCNGLMPNAFSRMAFKSGEQQPDAEARNKQMAERVQHSMEPEFSAGLCAYLASEQCQSTRSLYSSCAGRIARVFIGATTGWQGSRTEPASADDIAEHFAEICDLNRGVHIPESPGDEFSIVLGNAAPLIKGE